MDQEKEVCIGIWNNKVKKFTVSYVTSISGGKYVFISDLPNYVPDNTEWPETWADWSEMGD